MLHVKHLEDTFGIGPHTISIPRIRMAEGVDLELFPNIVSDEQFKTIIAVLRLAVPYTGMIISTREEKISGMKLFLLAFHRQAAVHVQE